MEQVRYSLEHRRGECNDVTRMHLKGGKFKIPVTKVYETTCGLSFQLTKGGIDDGIEDGYQTESFDNNKHQICQMDMKFSKWETSVCR
jgi:hypothetical protein